jgi:cation transport ATPase
VDVVREGQTRRAPIERAADLLTGYFVPVVTLLAIATWVIWLCLGQSGALPSDYLDISIGGWRKIAIVAEVDKKLTSSILQLSGHLSLLLLSSSSLVPVALA